MDTPRSDTLKTLIRESGLPILRIAREAGVPPQPLWRWFTGRTEKYDVDAAHTLEKYLREVTTP